MKINLEPRKTNDLELWKTILEPWKTMKTNLEPWKINLEPWNMKHDIYQLNWIRLGGPHYLRTSATTLQYFSNIFLHFCNTFHLHWLKNVALLTRRPNWPPWLKKKRYVTHKGNCLIWKWEQKKKRRKTCEKKWFKNMKEKANIWLKKNRGGRRTKKVNRNFICYQNLLFIIYYLSFI